MAARLGKGLMAASGRWTIRKTCHNLEQVSGQRRISTRISRWMFTLP
jgi:hypothetical protein